MSRTSAVCISVAFTALLSSAHAQVILTHQSAWTSSLPNPPPLIQFNASGNRVFQTWGAGSTTMARAGALGVGTQNFWIFNPDSSHANYRLTFTQTFAVNAPAVVQTPLYYKGTMNFFGSGTNDSFGLAVGGFKIYDAANNLVLDNSQSDSRTPAQGNLSVNRALLQTANINAGTYTIRGSLEVVARTAATGGGSTGTGINVDFFSGTSGVAGAVGVWPQGLAGSRNAVRAPQARQQFGVTGAGVDVGLIEVGRPYRNGDPINAHPSLAGRLFTINNPAAQSPNMRSEHAQAVASIIASNDPNPENAGIAPAATITTAALASYPVGAGANRPFARALAGLVANNIRVINMSATTFAGAPSGTDPAGDTALVNQTVNANHTLTFVKSSGNNGGNVTTPGTAYNAITVGALNRDFTRRRPTSSFGSNLPGFNPFKPDLVAPGEYVNVAAAFGGGYTRAFTGEHFDTPRGPNTGSVNGTSFAAPHVSGAAALLYHYHDQHPATHDQDHRVIKAVLLNSASTNVQRSGGGAWAQVTNGGAATPANPLVVLRSLDPQLGAGKLHVEQALRQYEPAEARVADNNAQQNLSIDVTTKNLWWDHDTVVARNGATPGTVDYIVGHVSGHLRATLTWNADNAGNVPDLQMRIFQEADTPNNRTGWDAADVEVARTLSRISLDGGATIVSQNVGLFDFNLPPFMGVGPFQNPRAGEYFVSVFNMTTVGVEYGIAAMIPEPGSLALLAAAGLLLARRRRK